MSFRGLLNQTVVIERQSNRTDDAYAAETWATNVTTVGRLVRSPRSRGKEINSDRRVTINQLVLNLPAGTDVIEEDRADIGGKKYNVITVYNAHGHHIECDVEHVT